jgi:hypothetical protein
LLVEQTAGPDYKTAYAFAHPFMKAMGDVIMGWMLHWCAVVATPKLEALVGSLDDEATAQKLEKNKHAALYHGQLQSARYFISSVLPVTLGRLAAIRAGDVSVLTISERGFGGK